MNNHEKQPNIVSNSHKVRGNAWKSDKGGIYMTRCYDCGKENYALNVITGICTWCGYKATEEDVNE